MEEDKISKLPDEILHHILARVDLKKAVQTSILAKRWKNLWRSLSDLSFRYRSLAYRNGYVTAWYGSNRRFIHSVTEFLSNRDNLTTTSRFHLSSDQYTTDSRFVEKCLDYALNHGVEHLDLDAYCSPTPLKFPDRLFACQTLRVLKLKQYKDSVVIPKPFMLSKLEILHLERFTFKDDGDIYSFPEEPFSIFPNLEKLSLCNCEVYDLIISASKLRILEIFFHDVRVFSCEKVIEEISTPRLTSFRYEGHVSLVCHKMVLPCLEEVYFDISPNLESSHTDGIQKKMPLNTVNMLQQLGKYAKIVTLTLTTIDVLEMDLNLLKPTPSPFPHIKCLVLTKRPRAIYFLTKIVPSTVMNYLTGGGDSLVVKFTKDYEIPSLESKLRKMEEDSAN